MTSRRLSLLFLLFPIVLLGGCVRIASPGPAPVPPSLPLEADIFYATDRAPLPFDAKTCDPVHERDQVRTYGGERSREGKLSLGTYATVIARDHKTGDLVQSLPRPVECRPPKKQPLSASRASPLPENEYFSALAARVNASPRREVLVFVHGFNISFAEAAQRTAQLQYDLDFAGPAVLFSWTSKASVRPSKYQEDERSVEAGLGLLVSFLEDLQRARPERIHVIAHSMGGRALMRALEEMARRAAENPRPRFAQIILAAPDMDRDEFIRLAPATAGMAQRVTLYASAVDRALAVAGDSHKVPRAGESGDFVIVLPAIDTVDVSAVGGGWFTFGHSYYGENRAVLADIYQLLHNNTPPQSRFGLFRMPHKDGHYWAFRR